MGKDRNAGWKRGDPIVYMREEIPAFEIPAYDGERYEAMAPDTLDLQERAALAVNVLTGSTDPEADYEMYWLVSLSHNPPMMQHDFSDHCQCKFLEALPLMRIISGSGLNEHVDRRWMEVLLRQQGPDGALHTPLKGRPWAAMNGQPYMGEIEPEDDQYVDPFHVARSLTAMMLYHRRDPAGPWREMARRAVDALVRRAVYQDDYAYYSPTCMCTIEGRTDDPMSRHRMVAAHVSFLVLGLVHAHREIGYAPALELAGKLVRYTRNVLRYPDEEGRFEPREWAHFHMHTYTLLANLEYARQVGDEALLENTRKGYEYAKANGCVLLGYFPEFLDSGKLEHSELCEVADMIALAIKLTDAGVGDYLDDADRWVRNMFAEGQLTPDKADWLRLYAKGKPVSAVNAMNECTDRVLERNIGAFAGWPKANDWYGEEAEGIMHCCTGNAARAIYFIWEKILTFDAGRLRVNLLLNRASPWADVDSHVPYVGQVDVRIKRAADLSIRIPEWVSPEQVNVCVNGDPRGLSWLGRYAGVGQVQPGDVATMTFPIAERTDELWVEKELYQVVRKGNDVVAIRPPGKVCPFYQRAHYRQNATRLRKIERFVSAEVFPW